MKPMKQCNHPSCRNLIPFDQQYCAQHIHMKREKHKVYDAARKREEPHLRALYNSDRWRKLSKQVKLRDDHMCQECLRNGRYTPADVTDHIIEVRDDWERRWDISNMEALCHECHNRKTLEEAKRREGKRK